MKPNVTTSLPVATLRAFILTAACAGVLSMLPVDRTAVAEDKVSKFLLLKLSREQSQALCTSASFNSCMGFTEKACFELSEEALQQCIMPLPDSILLSELDNEALEACPQKVYADAGFTEEKAQACLQDVLTE